MDKAQPAGSAPVRAGGGPLSRFLGALTAPSATFATVAADPRWLGVLALVVGIVTVCIFAFLSTEVGQLALYDRQERLIETFTQNAPPERLEQIQEQLERGMARARWTTAAAQLVGLPLSALIVAGLLFGVFSGILGGNASFKQVFAVVVHASAVLAVSQLLVQPVNYVLESMTNPMNLGALFPFLDETSFLARLLGLIDLFYIWWLAVLAIGLGVLYRRRAGPILAGLSVTYVVVALVVAAVMTAFSGA